MAKEKPIYRKLTGLHRSLGLMSQLWLGPDHLLHVHSTGYTETYRRLYFRDVQAMLLVYTQRRVYIGIAIGLLALITLLIANSFDASWGTLGILLALFAPFWIWNQLLGSGCRVVMVTAVQQENVPSLNRVPKTRRIIADLKQLIETAQADLTSAAPAPRPSAGDPPLLAPGGASEPPPLPPPLPT